jgi:hypothetical protein
MNADTSEHAARDTQRDLDARTTRPLTPAVLRLVQAWHTTRKDAA